METKPKNLSEALKIIDGKERQIKELHEKLSLANSDLLQLTMELEDRVEQKTKELQKQNQVLAVQISERKRAEQELSQILSKLKESQSRLIQAEKLGALGTLTAGIAHELNNPMMGMLNFLQYCLKKTEKEDERYAVLLDAERETKRCIAIVKNLSTFSRMDKEGSESFQPESLKDIIERVLRLLSYRIEKEGVEITHTLSDEFPPIEVKPGNIQQVFLNLIGNAMDAVKENQHKRIQIHVKPLNHHVEIAITDNGCGIEDKIKSRLFDPFFTTKPPGKGTGLGLSVCHSIVKDHCGKIMVDSRPNIGTTFEIHLPLKQKPKPIKILIVDDEKSFNQLLVRAFQKAGDYEVESVSNGSSALIKLGTFLPDILILDINMSEMDGLEVCRSIRKEPTLKNTKVIIVTGFRNDPRIEKIKHLGISKIQFKPLDLPLFLEEIERLT